MLCVDILSLRFKLKKLMVKGVQCIMGGLTRLIREEFRVIDQLLQKFHVHFAVGTGPDVS